MAMSVEELKAGLLQLDAETRARLIAEVEGQAYVAEMRALLERLEAEGRHLSDEELDAEIAERKGGPRWD